MDEDRFQHMLALSAIYIPILRTRALFEDVKEMDAADIHNTLNCLQIIADTFVEMQRRLDVRPRFTVKATCAALDGKE